MRRGSSPVRGYISPHLPVSQVHFWLLANNHYIHGAYILEIVKEQWEHNTIKVRVGVGVRVRVRVSLTLTLTLTLTLNLTLTLTLTLT